MIYNVSFPKLGFVDLKINPVALKFENVTIYWYGVIIAIGFLLAFLYCLKRCKDFNLNQNEFVDYVLVSTIFSIIGARIYYVIFFPGDDYKENFLKIFSVSEGGIAIYGAIIGGILGALILWLIKKRKANLRSLLDLMCLGCLIGQTIGRWGNFFNQEAFGTATDLIFGMKSEMTGGQMVHPCFLYESIGCLFIFLFLHFQKKLPNGKLFLMYIFMYGILRALIESLRTDSLIIPGTFFRVSQVLAIVSSAVALIFLFLQNRWPKSENQTS